jgi:hypothetical protein
VLSLGLAVAFLLAGKPAGAFAFTVGWAALTAGFCLRRLSGISHLPGHVIEMAATSMLVPLLSVYWRLCGAIRFRVLFL